MNLINNNKYFLIKRLNNIDFLKGVLIIFVITGHLIPGILNKTLIRYIIYFFHMPLFIGISGYLINIQKFMGG